MKSYPSIPALEAVPDDHFEGNLWLQELVDGRQLRFQVGPGGYVRFGDSLREFDEEPSLRYRVAVAHVRASFDVDAFLAEVDDPGAYTFFGEATVLHSLEYDWDRTPPFLGFDVWDGTRERWLPADAVARAFERLGLDAVHAFERELPARHFYPDRWETPDSAYRDGPPAGVVVRDKHGNRAKRLHPSFEPDPDDTQHHPDPTGLAEETVTPERVAAAAERLERAGQPVTFEPLFEATVAEVFRRTRWTLDEDDHDEVRAFRSAAAERVRRWLDGH